MAWLPFRQDSEIAALYDLARAYTRMAREKRPGDLDVWLAASRESGIGALVAFAEGLW